MLCQKLVINKYQNSFKNQSIISRNGFFIVTDFVFIEGIGAVDKDDIEIKFEYQ